MRIRRPWYAIVALLACLLMSACGGGVSQSNYDKINTGMTEQEVENILGKPTTGEGGAVPGLSGANKEWVDDGKKITVTFLNGKVTMKAKSGF